MGIYLSIEKSRFKQEFLFFAFRKFSQVKQYCFFSFLKKTRVTYLYKYPYQCYDIEAKMCYDNSINNIFLLFLLPILCVHLSLLQNYPYQISYFSTI